MVPSLADARQYPVIAGICLVAIAVTLAWWMKWADISMLLDNVEIQRGQLWRLLTDIFPHLTVTHLIFNLYWTWIFGTVIEARLGHRKTLLVILLLGVGSSAAQFALAGGGAGLSGVGYGLFGMLWVLSKRDPRFEGTMPKSTVNLFLGWFALCVVLTVTNVWNVGNAAHGGGAVLGVLIGLAIAEPARPMVWAVAAAAVTAATLWGATLGRPLVNYSDAYAYDEAQLGYDALRAGKNAEAVIWFSNASKRLPADAVIWYDLGLAYDRVGDTEKADAAYTMAHQLKPDDPDYGAAAGRRVLELLKKQQSGEKP